jgi:hypothetical protein
MPQATKHGILATGPGEPILVADARAPEHDSSTDDSAHSHHRSDRPRIHQDATVPADRQAHYTTSTSPLHVRADGIGCHRRFERPLVGVSEDCPGRSVIGGVAGDDDGAEAGSAAAADHLRAGRTVRDRDVDVGRLDRPDRRVAANLAGRSGRSLRAGVPLRALLALDPRVALRALRARVALRALWPDVALGSLLVPLDRELVGATRLAPSTSALRESLIVITPPSRQPSWLRRLAGRRALR